MAESHEMIDHGRDAAAVVDADGGDAALARAMPQGYHRDAGVLQVLDEIGPVAQVAQEEEGVTVARLQDGPQGFGLVGAAMSVTEYDVVATPVGLQRGGFDGAGEEGIGDIAHDDAEQHGRRTTQAARQGVGSVAQSPRGLHDPLTGGLGDRHCGRRAAQDTRDGRL